MINTERRRLKMLKIEISGCKEVNDDTYFKMLSNDVSKSKIPTIFLQRPSNY